MESKIYDKEKLEKALLSMSGKDFAAAEKEARLEGDTSIDIMTSRTFYAALAARALKKPLPDIMELPLKEYAAITGDIGTFLLTPESAKKQESPVSLEK